MRTQNEALPPSLTHRAVAYIRQGMNVTDALKQAVQDEQDLILSVCPHGYYGREKYKAVADAMGKQVYNDIRRDTP